MGDLDGERVSAPALAPALCSSFFPSIASSCSPCTSALVRDLFNVLCGDLCDTGAFAGDVCSGAVVSCCGRPRGSASVVRVALEVVVLLALREVALLATEVVVLLVLGEVALLAIDVVALLAMDVVVWLVDDETFSRDAK